MKLKIWGLTEDLALFQGELTLVPANLHALTIDPKRADFIFKYTTRAATLMFHTLCFFVYNNAGSVLKEFVKSIPTVWTN